MQLDRQLHTQPDSATPNTAADLILVGGGLANGLIALRLKMLRPALRLLLLEQGDTFGGNHTWSFHEGDLDAAQLAWVKPLVAYRWPRHSVIFPGHTRRLATAYASITSTRFDAFLRTALGESACTGMSVAQLGPKTVTLSDGRVLHAHAVIDGRGARASEHLVLGFQKFLGQELRLAQPHGLDGPVLMDATVAQQDGYRFIYLLPFTADTLLVEDTFYADGSAFDVNQLRANIAAYVQARKWTVAELLREEQGVLPITLGGNLQAFWRQAQGVPRAGLAAGLFHSTTGYSLPDAVRLADGIAALPDLSSDALFASVHQHALRHWQAQGFFRLLNRMLFRAAKPAQRWRVMQRFYGLPTPLIGRFYAGQLRWTDKARILTGKPPVPLVAAVRAAFSFPSVLAQKDTR